MPIILCDSCKGKKQLMALGGIMKDCPTCNGIGYKEKQEDEKSVVTIVKKKSNKKRVTECQSLADQPNTLMN